MGIECVLIVVLLLGVASFLGWAIHGIINYGLLGREHAAFVMWPQRTPWLYRVRGPVYVKQRERDLWFSDVRCYILGVFPIWVSAENSCNKGHYSEADAWKHCHHHRPRIHAERMAKNQTVTITTKEIGS